MYSNHGLKPEKLPSLEDQGPTDHISMHDILVSEINLVLVRLTSVSFSFSWSFSFWLKMCGKTQTDSPVLEPLVAPGEYE